MNHLPTCHSETGHIPSRTGEGRMGEGPLVNCRWLNPKQKPEKHKTWTSIWGGSHGVTDFWRWLKMAPDTWWTYCISSLRRSWMRSEWSEMAMFWKNILRNENRHRHFNQILADLFSQGTTYESQSSGSWDVGWHPDGRCFSFDFPIFWYIYILSYIPLKPHDINWYPIQNTHAHTHKLHPRISSVNFHIIRDFILLVYPDLSSWFSGLVVDVNIWNDLYRS